MSQSVRSLALLVFVALSVAPSVRGEPANGKNSPRGKIENPIRTDLHGDPLPEGALARLGKRRLSNPLSGEQTILLAFSPSSKALAAGR
ncbi:MAG TPA: hypothetical protein VKE94_19630, partial [Gemmataceae bacterium]|nr:hypothetical protein [Gemmataceae bacterium]